MTLLHNIGHKVTYKRLYNSHDGDMNILYLYKTLHCMRGLGIKVFLE